ncbi:MAG: 16S rRNA processing protein RimM [Oscillospiraceae bacterium]|nr:MAG: 16S rRNA processing protein RimM [Oscillospiraceae bacterium]
MRKPFLECGKIVSTHGIAGEVRVQPWCDSPQDLEGIRTLYFDRGATPVGVLRARAHKNVVLLKLEGVDTVEAAQALRGRVLWAAREDIPLEEGEYFVQDLLGMEVFDADTGRKYGVLTDVSETGANDVYHITFPDGAVRLIPVIDEVVLSTDPDQNRMEIRPLKGLFDDED